MLKLWNQCSRIEKILLLIAAPLLSASAGFLFYFDYMISQAKILPKDQIAEVISSKAEIKRRSPISFEFQTIKPGDIIGNGDTIYSGERSTALVKFLKGSKLVIGEQSLVVLRNINGKTDLKIEKGGVSGLMTEAEEIEIKTEDDSVLLNGKEDSQFAVSYKPGMGMEVVSFNNDIKLEYRGEEVNLKTQKAIISKSNGIEVSEYKQQNGKSRDNRNIASKDENAKPFPDGVSIDDKNLINQMKLSLSSPFPKINHVFLHSKGGQIPIFPKDQCIDGCQIEIQINNGQKVIKKFAKNTIPIVYLKIEKSIESNVKWTFKDGVETKNGEFEISVNNELNFGKALKSNKPIEVVN